MRIGHEGSKPAASRTRRASRSGCTGTSSKLDQLGFANRRAHRDLRCRTDPRGSAVGDLTGVSRCQRTAAVVCLPAGGLIKSLWFAPGSLVINSPAWLSAALVAVSKVSAMVHLSAHRIFALRPSEHRGAAFLDGARPQARRPWREHIVCTACRRASSRWRVVQCHE